MPTIPANDNNVRPTDAGCVSAAIVVAAAVAMLALPAVGAAAVVVVEDLRAVATQLSGQGTAGSMDAFNLSQSASAEPGSALSALLHNDAADGGASGNVVASQQSAIAAGGGIVSLSLTGSANATATTADNEASVLAAAISNLTFGFRVETAPARIAVQAAISGSGFANDLPGSFGLVALSVISDGAALLSLVSQTADPVALDATLTLQPGDYLMTLAANSTVTLPAGNGPAGFSATTSYAIAVSVTTVPLPASVVVFPCALAVLGFFVRRLSDASC